MTLSDKQAAFTAAITDLLNYANLLAYTSTPHLRIRLDYARRCEFCPVNGLKRSTHISRLAVDLLLDEKQPDGSWKWVQGRHICFERLGEIWERMGVALDLPTRWGGRFRDYGHYSFEHEGVK